MRIAVLGSGTMGTALAKRIKRAGHNVVTGARDPTGKPDTTSYGDAVERSEVIFLAISWPHGLDVVKTIGDFGGRVLVDVSNPEGAEGRSLVLGHNTSGAEEIARVARGARMVKAFNHFYAELLLDDGIFSDRLAVPFCGDDAEARKTVGKIIDSLGLDGIDSGPLQIARYLEPFAMLTVQLVREQKLGPTGMAWRLLRNNESDQLTERTSK